MGSSVDARGRLSPILLKKSNGRPDFESRKLASNFENAIVGKDGPLWNGSEGALANAQPLCRLLIIVNRRGVWSTKCISAMRACGHFPFGLNASDNRQLASTLICDVEKSRQLTSTGKIGGHGQKGLPLCEPFGSFFFLQCFRSSEVSSRAGGLLCQPWDGSYPRIFAIGSPH